MCVCLFMFRRRRQRPTRRRNWKRGSVGPRMTGTLRMMTKWRLSWVSRGSGLLKRVTDTSRTSRPSSQQVWWCRHGRRALERRRAWDGRTTIESCCAELVFTSMFRFPPPKLFFFLDQLDPITQLFFFFSFEVILTNCWSNIYHAKLAKMDVSDCRIHFMSRNSYLLFIVTFLIWINKIFFFF